MMHFPHPTFRGPRPFPLLLALLLACPRGPGDPAPKGDDSAVDTGREDSETGDSGETDDSDTGDSDSGDSDSGDTGDTLPCDPAALDPYLPGPITVRPTEPVAGSPLSVNYTGPLADRADVTLHYGFNGWELLTGMTGWSSESTYGDQLYYLEAPMTRLKDGSWTVEVPIPEDARALHMVFRTSAGEWDNNDHLDYHQSITFPYLGPYLTWNHEATPTEGIVVHYETSVAGLGVVTWGEDPETLTHCAVGTIRDTLHRIPITGLEAGRRYYYRVHDALGHSSETFSFVTAEASASDYEFLVLSDAQDDGDSLRWGDVAAELAASYPEARFILFAGDLAIIDNAGYWWIFFDRARDLLSGRALMPAPGNHDTPSFASSTDISSFLRYFDLPYDTEGDAWYGFDYGNAHFLALDSENTPSLAIGGEQYVFAQEDLAACGAGDARAWEHVFSYFHVPPYNAAPRHGAEQALVRDVTGLFDGVVDWHFSGHEHLYQRTLPLRYNGVIAPSGEYGVGEEEGDEDGVGYIVLPPAGAWPDMNLIRSDDPEARRRERLAYPVVGPTETAVDSEIGFVVARVEGSTLSLETWGMGTTREAEAPHLKDHVP